MIDMAAAFRQGNRQHMIQRSFQSYPLATFLCIYTTKHDRFGLIKNLVAWPGLNLV